MIEDQPHSQMVQMYLEKWWEGVNWIYLAQEHGNVPLLSVK